MFGDLKRAFEAMQKSSFMQLVNPMTTNRSRVICIPEERWKEFVDEYKICFVEPEDDTEWKEWQDDESTSSKP